jgi:hypothetical protein
VDVREAFDKYAHQFDLLVRDGTTLHAGETNTNRRLVSSKSHADAILKADPSQGVGYAFTDVVHCASAGEKGVKEAVNECAPRYLSDSSNSGRIDASVQPEHAPTPRLSAFRMRN